MLTATTCQYTAYAHSVKRDNMKVLVTAFDPFGGDNTNSSQIVLNLLPEVIENVIINKMVIPTVYIECAEMAFAKALENDIDVIIALGQAGGRDGIWVETVGVNYALSKTADNKGNVLYGEKLFENGENAYFSDLPVKLIEENINRLGFKCNLSASAGGFVCNSMLYTILKKAHEGKPGIKSGFIHLPYCESQGKEGLSMKDSDIALCVIKAIETVIKSNHERNNV